MSDQNNDLNTRAMIVASREFLATQLPSDFNEWSEEDQDSFLLSNALSPFQCRSPNDLWRKIDSLATTIKSFLESELSCQLKKREVAGATIKTVEVGSDQLCIIRTEDGGLVGVDVSYIGQGVDRVYSPTDEHVVIVGDGLSYTKPLTDAQIAFLDQSDSREQMAIIKAFMSGCFYADVVVCASGQFSTGTFTDGYPCPCLYLSHDEAKREMEGVKLSYASKGEQYEGVLMLVKWNDDDTLSFFAAADLYFEQELARKSIADCCGF